MTTTRTTQVEATPQNINDAIALIAKYAKYKGYTFNENDVPAFRENSLAFWQGRKLEFQSKSQMKVCRNYLTRFNRKVTMAQANMFIHFMYRGVMKLDGPVPKIQYSEQEQKIRAAKKAWKIVQIESDRLLSVYKETKGDYFKNK